MFDQKKAAEYFVVAWCKDWTLGQYMNTVLGDKKHETLFEAIESTVEAYPWMPSTWQIYKRPLREFVARAYPKLNVWLWNRPDDIARLKCAAQIEKLRPKGLAGRVTDADRAEMSKAGDDFMQEAASYAASRSAFKTHGRSAWTVCKA